MPEFKVQLKKKDSVAALVVVYAPQIIAAVGVLFVGVAALIVALK